LLDVELRVLFEGGLQDVEKRQPGVGIQDGLRPRGCGRSSSRDLLR